MKFRTAYSYRYNVITYLLQMTLIVEYCQAQTYSNTGVLNDRKI